jgi:luciferase family oxidoreductase group 1
LSDEASRSAMSVPLSVLDLAPIPAGGTAVESLRRTVELARRAEALGYRRFWLAEHHGMPSIASSAPEVLIAHVAAATTRLRVGSGGVMLPNHPPLRVAEVFHTLAALHPGRIDLGIGRAPGTDPLTVSALRPFDAEGFPDMLAELFGLSRGDLPAGHPFQRVRVVPAGVPLPPVWILGSSGATARLAAALGTGYSFASHFSPTSPLPALRAYRESFRPSADFPAPHVILGAAVVCADTDAEAHHLASSMDLVWVRLHRGDLREIPTPEEAQAYPYTPEERAIARARRELTVVGSPATVRARLATMVEEAAADEIMIATTTHDPARRLRSYELVAEAFAAP